MRRKLQYIIAGAVVLCIAAGCILLPLAIFGFQDRNLMGRVLTEEVEETNTSIQHTMTIVEKLNFYNKVNDYMYDAGQMISAIPLEQGARLTQETVWNVCQEELARLAELGLAQSRQREPISEDKRYANSLFYINTDDPTQNMIAWNLEFADNEGGVLVQLDDETGKILKYMYRFSNDALWKDGLDVVAEKWAEYLGVEYQGIQAGISAIDGAGDASVAASAVTVRPSGSDAAYDESKERYIQKMMSKMGSENLIYAKYVLDGVSAVYPLVKYANGYSFGDFGIRYNMASGG